MDHEHVTVPEILNPQEKKTVFELEKRDVIFAVGALLVSVFTAIFGISGGFALGYTLSILLMAALFGVYFAKGAKLQAYPMICGVLAIANAAVFVYGPRHKCLSRCTVVKRSYY